MTAAPIQELQKIATIAVELCLPYIIENLSLIDNGSATHLLGDFRANMSQWKTLISFTDLITNVKPEEEYKDRKKLFILFLMNDGLIEGYIYLLPSLDGAKMNYALRVAPPAGVNADKFKEVVLLFDKIKTNR